MIQAIINAITLSAGLVVLTALWLGLDWARHT